MKKLLNLLLEWKKFFEQMKPFKNPIFNKKIHKSTNKGWGAHKEANPKVNPIK